MKKIIIDNEVLFIENLEKFGDSDSGFKENGRLSEFLKAKTDDFVKALHPIVLVGKAIKTGVAGLSPDEVELQMELKLGMDGDNNVAFAIVKGQAEASVSIKFVWKKDELNSKMSTN